MAQSYLDDLFGLSGQLAVVIGGTGVLGGALAEGLGKAGATVVVAGRDEGRGQARARAINEAGGKASFEPVDVMTRSSIQTLFETVVARHGKVDMLINGAGVNNASPYFEMTDENWDRVFDSNLKAVHWGCQIFGKHMAENGGGSIVNIASVTSHIPLSRVIAYSASKSAVLSLTLNVARELAPMGVRVNALCPGFFPAEQNRKILDPARVEKILSHTPMGRFGEPQELVGTTLLLISRRAGSFVTGAAFYVDGGFTGSKF